MTPFDIDGAGAYGLWRAEKLMNYP